MRVLLICLAIVTAGPVSALSCMRPDAVRLFERARDSKDSFYIVTGRVDLVETPSIPKPGAKTPERTRAKITGQALSSSGFNAPFEREVMVEATCLASWCGSPEGLSGALIMAIKIEFETLTLRVGPCGGDQVTWDQLSEDRLLTCHLDGVCEPAEF